MPISHPPARRILEEGFSDRITIRGDGAECSFQQAKRRVDTWKQDGMFTVFCLGGFDVFHLNHNLGLTRCRTLGAMAMLGLESATTDTEVRAVHQAAATAVRMIVSIDTDAAIAKGKSRNADHGGGPKPTLSWLSRAKMVAGQSMALPDSDLRVPLADFITSHGEDHCDIHTEANPCPTRRHRPNIVALQPDALVAKEDLSSLDLLRQEQAAGNLPHTAIVLFSEQHDALTDPMLGGPISATAISARIRS